MSKREYKDYLEDIRDAIKAIEQFTGGLSKEEFRGDLKTVYASIKAIEIIGEAASKIPKSFRDKNKEIPWRDMADMRNKLAHEYFGIDLNVLWETIRRGYPTAKGAFVQHFPGLKQGRERRFISTIAINRR